MISSVEALKLLWRLIDLALGLWERTDAASGRTRDVFREAITDLGVLADWAKSDPEEIAACVFDGAGRRNGNSEVRCTGSTEHDAERKQLLHLAK